MKPGRKGFTLVEMVLSAGILGAAAVLLASYFSRTSRTQSALETMAETNSQAIDLAASILSTGRSSDSCMKPCPPPGRPIVPLSAGQTCELQCHATVDLGDLDFAFVRNPAAGTVLHLERRGTGGWVTVKTFQAPAVTGLTICGETELAAGTCAFAPGMAEPLGTAFRAARAASFIPANRFYRVRVLTQAQANGPGHALQTSFFVRNPLLGFQDSGSLNGSLRLVPGTK